MYTVEIALEVQLEIEKYYAWYLHRASLQVAENFIADLQNAYQALAINPFFQIRTKNFRALPLRNFPFLVFFAVDENSRTVSIVDIFNTHQDTTKYPQ
jgi:plasmid stabilization system protein ParE